jgi:hypothetical protein
LIAWYTLRLEQFSTIYITITYMNASIQQWIFHKKISLSFWISIKIRDVLSFWIRVFRRLKVVFRIQGLIKWNSVFICNHNRWISFIRSFSLLKFLKISFLIGKRILLLFKRSKTLRKRIFIKNFLIIMIKKRKIYLFGPKNLRRMIKNGKLYMILIRWWGYLKNIK